MQRWAKKGLYSMGLLLAISLAVGCSDDDGGGDGPQPTATPSAIRSDTPAATPTPTEGVGDPTATPSENAALRGILLVHREVRAGAGDALAAAPELGFVEPGFVGRGFDRSLSFADWSLTCDGSDEVLAGTTDADGRFAVETIEAGECSLEVTKTVGGNLMLLEMSITVGDDGAEVVAEVSWGRVRVASLYTLDGIEHRTIATNGGAKVVLRQGTIVEIADYARQLVDDDGDGTFETPQCGESVWQCSDFDECGDRRYCACTASCPFCDDCGPPVCVFPGASGLNPYQCNEDGSCANADDVCVCASSSPDSTDCPQQVCVSPCQPVELGPITVYGSAEMIDGQQGSFTALMELSDGSVLNVTGVADWASSDDTIVSASSWGAVEALAAGTAQVTAALGEETSAPFQVVVRPRPALRLIHLQNYDCYPVPFYGPEPALIDEAFLPPSCGDAVEIGGTLQFHAFGEFDDFYYEDITDEVTWSVTPAGVATIEGGLFTGAGEGAATVQASLDGVDSDSREIRVVTERSVVDLSIYPDSYYYLDFVAVADIEPCFGPVCPGVVSTLTGDEIRFHATARYDIGGWEDVTEQVEWVADAPAVVQFGEAGVATAAGEGETTVRATLGEVESHPYGVRVVAEATVQHIEIYQQGANAQDRVIEVGGNAYFHANGYYDVGFSRDATDDADWHTGDESVARFDEPGVLTGLAAGSVAVWAEIDGVRSQVLFMEVFEQTDIDFCDIENVNRGTWTDGFNRVFLESDCADYEVASDVVQLRFTVTETERPGGIFDPCLDLYAFRVDGGVETFVRTIREEGCGEPFLEAGAPEFEDAALRYQLQAFWDLKDDSGAAVTPGTYRIKGRFYLYYDPVVTIDVEVR